MMRHFVAFSLLLFVLENSVEAITLCFPHTHFPCKQHCLKKNCQFGHCGFVREKRTSGGYFLRYPCVCKDCPAGQKENEQLH
ncbi:unnamed protein product [Cylicocyclus nassatus]|uniref:Uncharacterized protein n=1 Tax=Cylicocyclus nassatus TaxID=53992 RepID=A0AA36HBN5_CYLNA|nr:unnamed protein product [Cylicocyclus nassatus]